MINYKKLTLIVLGGAVVGTFFIASRNIKQSTVQRPVSLGDLELLCQTLKEFGNTFESERRIYRIEAQTKLSLRFKETFAVVFPNIKSEYREFVFAFRDERIKLICGIKQKHVTKIEFECPPSLQDMIERAIAANPQINSNVPWTIIAN